MANSYLWPVFFERLLIVLILTIPFEIRDMDQDDRTLGTLPQRLGIKGVKILGTLLGVGYLLIDLLYHDTSTFEHLVSVAFVVLCLALMWGASKRRSPYYSSFWVESAPFFWLLLMYLGKAFS